nr:hypothetical protein [Tanacetum cinerariifolium]
PMVRDCVGESHVEWCGVVREAEKCGTRVFRGWREILCSAHYFECRGDRGRFENFTHLVPGVRED